MGKLLSISYQSLVLLLHSTPHNLWEIHQGPSHVVTLGLLMRILILGLVGSGKMKVSILCYIL